MTYKVVSRIKTGNKDDGFEYLERGDSVSKSKLKMDDEEFAALEAAGVIMEADEFDAAFPELEEGKNQPAGTPSNLEQIEGTEQQANLLDPDEEEEEEPPTPVNPADPPDVGTPAGEE